MRANLLAHSLVLLLLASFAAPSYGAQACGDARAFIAELTQKALRLGSDETVSVADRQQGIERLLDEDFDLPRIARFVLGRYWRDATDGERAEFTDRFSDYMVKMYSQRFASYSGETFRVVKQRPENETTTLVGTEITRSSTGEPVAVGWRVAKTPEGYKITDIDVGGVSLVLAQRDEIASAIQQNGGTLPGLFRQLRKKMDELELSAK